VTSTIKNLTFDCDLLFIAVRSQPLPNLVVCLVLTSKRSTLPLGLIPMRSTAPWALTLRKPHNLGTATTLRQGVRRGHRCASYPLIHAHWEQVTMTRLEYSIFLAAVALRSASPPRTRAFPSARPHRAPHWSFKFRTCFGGQSAVISWDQSNSLASMP
jgi:hypothetical protein